MKKILFIAAIAAMACACGNKAANEEAVAEDSVVVEEVAACCAEKAEGECCGACEEHKQTLGEYVADKTGASEEVKEVVAEGVDAAAAKAVEALKK